MRRLTSIVAVNEDGAIGVGNALPWRVRSDLRFFRNQTRGNVVIMGRRTYDSLGHGLPDRKNIVVTHGFGMFSSTPTCSAAGSIDEALSMAERSRTKSQEVFVVGGASMYEQFAQYVDRYLITEVKKKVSEADTFLSAEIFGDLKGWDRQTIEIGHADGLHDEADYTIFELCSRHPDVMAKRRDAVFRSLEQRRNGNRLFAVPARMYASV